MRVGGSSFIPSGSGRFVFFGIRHGDSRSEYPYRDHEGREERNVHDATVIREHQQEPGEYQEDLDRLRPEYRPQRLPGRSRLSLRGPPTVYPARPDMDGSPEGGGYGPALSPEERRGQRETCGGYYLPLQDDADGPR